MTGAAPSADPIGALITLGELKALGRFVRWQEIDAAVAPLVEPHGLFAYPLLPSRLPPEPAIDICIEGIWRQVESFVVDRHDPRLLYEHRGRSGDRRLPADRPWFDVAPRGFFSERLVLEPPAFDPSTAGIIPETFRARHRDHAIATQRVVETRWPYLTFEVATCRPNAFFEPKEAPREIKTYHVADPRVRVPGIASAPPLFNAPIAVSHRWLTAADPDPDQAQFRELLRSCAQLRLDDRQAFLIDYCALPQSPRNDEEETVFNRDWPGFQRRFCQDVIVLNTGAADYATRAWCMLELVSASLGADNGGRVLNRDRLDEALHAAWREAAGFVQNRTYMHRMNVFPQAAGDARRFLADLRSNAEKLMIYNGTTQARRAVIERFEGDTLHLRHPDDRPRILAMLGELLQVVAVR